jgi:hypothetical protein
MSEASRAQRQRLLNLREELEVRHGPVPDEALPDWLDSIEGFYAHVEAPETANSQPGPAEASTEPPAQKRVLRVSEALQKLDQYGETAVYVCEVCGEQSAKASVPLGLWHCTACEYWGRVVPPRRGADW